MKTTLKELDKSQIEINFELSTDEFQKYFEKIFEVFKKELKIDGFRQGCVPDEIAREKIDSQKVLVEAAEEAIRESYLDYISKNQLEPLGKPEVKILKLAKGNPLIFTVKVAILPRIKLPDYRKIAAAIEKREIKVDPEEVEQALSYLQKSRARFIAKKGPAEEKDFVEIVYQNKYLNQGKEIEDKFILGEGGFIKGFEENILGMEYGQEKEFKVPIGKDDKIIQKLGIDYQEGMSLDFKIKLKGVFKMELPILDDNFAQTVGRFNNLEDLKKSIKEGLFMEKEEAERQRRRREILQKIIESTSFEVPEIMIEYEQERLLEAFKYNLKQELKLTLEEFLATTKQTEEELKNTYRKEGEKRIREILILREIGKKENVEVRDDEIEQEVNQFLKNLTLEQAQKFDIQRLKEYTKDIIYNEKVFQILENLSQ